jgi:hypothetical protein
MTAVEFIHEKLFCDEYWYEKLTFEQIIEQAKEMEKQQIIDALNEKSDETLSDEFCNNYYKETFVSKGSDEHIVDTNKMISSQTEISDEEIEKKSKYWNETTNPEMWTFKLAWKAGAKWYREQIKKL